MNSSWHVLESAWKMIPAERVGWALMQSVWQGAIVAVVLAAILVALRGRSARARYAVSCAALASMLVCPVATAVMAWAPRAGETRLVFPAEWGNAPVSEAPSGGAPQAQASGTDRVRVMPRMLAGASYAWAIGVGALSLWNLLGWARVRRLRSGSTPAACEWEARLSALASRMKVRGVVAMRNCADVCAPALIGWVRPIVLVPASALSGLSAAQLEALLLHELAHVRRHDYLVNLIQTGIETLLFYHPAAWWISARIRRERENCCDDLAALHCESPIAYARALTAMEEIRSGLPPAFALGAAGDGDLLRRIERLVGRRMEARPVRASPLTAGAGLAVLAAVLWLPGTKATVAGEQTKSPATHGGAVAEMPAGNPVTPDDLDVGKVVDYRIHPNDLLAITIKDLNGPNTETIKQARVTESGNVSMPYLKGPIFAVGKTEIELEQAIVKAYLDAALIQNANVSVTIIEPRGRAYSILSSVQAPGTYPIYRSPFRLLDAIAEAHGILPTVQVLGIRVLRQAVGNEPVRAIDLPASKVLAGDPSVNIVIRPGDTVIVTGTPPGDIPVRHARLVVGAEAMSFEGKRLDWDELARILAVMPMRQNTVLEIAAESPEVTVGRFFEVQHRAGDLAGRFGFKYVQPITQGGPVEVQLDRAPKDGREGR